MLHELNQGVVDIKDNRSYTKEFKLNRFMTDVQTLSILRMDWIFKKERKSSHRCLTESINRN